MSGNAADLESVWREAWITAPEGALTFYESLTARWQSARSLNRSGSLSNLSSNSSSHSYAPPSSNTRTTVDDERNALAALKLYEQIQSDLSTVDELAIYNEGIARFKISASECFHDFTLSRCSP